MRKQTTIIVIGALRVKVPSKIAADNIQMFIFTIVFQRKFDISCR